MRPERTRHATSFLAAAGAVGLAGVLMRACPGSCTSCVTCASSLAPMGASAAAVGIAFASSAGMRAKRGTSTAEGDDGMTGRPLAGTHRQRTKRARKALAAIVFVFLGRGLVAAAKHDSRVREEVGRWPEDTVIVLAVAPDGPKLTVRKGAGRLEYLGGKSPLEPTLHVEFKSIDVALPVLIGMKGVLQAFAEHRSILVGDIGLGMSLVRCLHIVEGYLFPDIMGKRILPRHPTREASRFAVYASTLTSSATMLQEARP